MHVLGEEERQWEKLNSETQPKTQARGKGSFQQRGGKDSLQVAEYFAEVVKHHPLFFFFFFFCLKG